MAEEEKRDLEARLMKGREAILLSAFEQLRWPVAVTYAAGNAAVAARYLQEVGLPFTFEHAFGCLGNGVQISLALAGVDALFTDPSIKAYANPQESQDALLRRSLIQNPYVWGFLASQAQVRAFHPAPLVPDFRYDALATLVGVVTAGKIILGQTSLDEVTDNPDLKGFLAAPLAAACMPYKEGTLVTELFWTQDEGRLLLLPVFPASVPFGIAREIAHHGRSPLDYPTALASAFTAAYAAIASQNVEQTLLICNVAGFGSKMLFSEANHIRKRWDNRAVRYSPFIGLGLTPGLLALREPVYRLIEGMTGVELPHDGTVNHALDAFLALGVSLKAAGLIAGFSPESRRIISLKLRRRLAELRRDYDTAISLQQQAVEADADERIGLASLCIKKGEYGEGLRQYREVLQQGRPAPSVLDFALEGLGLERIVDEVHRFSLKLRGTQGAELQYAFERLVKGHHADARRSLDRVLWHQSKSPELHLLYADVLDTLGEPSDAYTTRAIDMVVERPDFETLFRRITSSRHEMGVIDLPFIDESLVVKRDHEASPLDQEMKMTAYFFGRLPDVARPLQRRTYGPWELLFSRHAGKETLLEYFQTLSSPERWRVLCLELERLAKIHRMTEKDYQDKTLSLHDVLEDGTLYARSRLETLILPQLRSFGLPISASSEQKLLKNYGYIDEALYQWPFRAYYRDANPRNTIMSRDKRRILIDFEGDRRLPTILDVLSLVEFSGMAPPEDLPDLLKVCALAWDGRSIEDISRDRSRLGRLPTDSPFTLKNIGPMGLHRHLELATYRARDTMRGAKAEDDFHYHLARACRVAHYCAEEYPHPWSKTLFEQVALLNQH
ncbi:MAG: hypothetical protein V1735_04920 [Nanoarchaeota archaeon]